MNVSLQALMAAAAVAVLAGCGGDGGESAPPVQAATTLAGVAAKGPLKAARVTAYPVSDAGAVGATELGHDTSAADGSYRIDIGTYTGAVQVVVGGGAGTTTADEATGSDVPLAADFVLRANTTVGASASAQTQTVAVTPYTELAANVAAAAGGATPSNIANANGVVFALIGLDPVGTAPVASNAAAPAGATTAQLRYGLYNAAVSKLAASPPVTNDPAALACFAAAAASVQQRIACAVRQIAGAVSVTGSGAQATARASPKLAGLADALVAAAADPAINKSGLGLTTDDSAFKTLKAQEAAADNGNPPPIVGGNPQALSDVALAKRFFTDLRSNARALQAGTLDTGLVDRVQAFGDSMAAPAAALALGATDFARLTTLAPQLWADYRSGATTSNQRNLAGTFAGCVVYQSAFPTQIGGSNGTTTPYVATSLAATSPANARWVGCSANSGPLRTDGTRRYRRTILFDMEADATLSAVPYTAVTRAEYVQNGTTFELNLTPTLAGTAGWAGGFRLVGDLPPATTPAGALLAQRYVADIQGSQTAAADGVEHVTLSHGRLAVVAVGASGEGLVVDLSPDGLTRASYLPQGTDAAQTAAIQLSLAAKVTTPAGSLNGTLLVENLQSNAGGDLNDGHVRFKGDIAVAAAGSAAPAPLFSGTLDVKGGSRPVVGFDGTLSLPQRPAATLMLSVTGTTADAAEATFEGRYVQSGLTVTIGGTRGAAGTSATFADAGGVSTTVTSTSNTAQVTVGGRATATIDKRGNVIRFVDGTFESVF